MADDQDRRIQTTRKIAAPAAAIFALLSDPQGHVAIDSSGMLQSAEGDPVTAVGDTFVVHMDRESLNDYPELGRYDVTVKITAYEPDTEIAWTILSQMDPPLGHVYGYRLEEVDGGTEATSYYDWSDAHEVWRDSGVFPVLDEGALRATLGILSRQVTS
ncbi:MAG TPA: SRPBCC family protein [Acidimicrobiales bacterium]|nr:SRPBCC family protein [Acidimicrobiales bacterium]